MSILYITLLIQEDMIATKCKCNLSTKECGVDSPLTSQFHHCKCQVQLVGFIKIMETCPMRNIDFGLEVSFIFFIFFLLLLLETNIVLSWIKYKEG